MKTAEQIIALLEMELADAYEQRNLARGVDAQAVFHQLIRATTIQNLLDAIKAPEGMPATEESRPAIIGHLERALMNGEITEAEYKKKKVWYVETLLELYAKDIITEDELKQRLNK